MHVFLACSTSRVFLDEVCVLVPDASSRVVDMIGLLAKDASERGMENAFLLASEGTIASRVYQDEFGKCGILVDSASEYQQARLRDFIEVVKQNKVSFEAKEAFAGFVRDIAQENVILGCTELPLLVDEGLDYGGTQLLDPMQAAIDFLVEQQSRTRDAKSF